MSFLKSSCCLLWIVMVIKGVSFRTGTSTTKRKEGLKFKTIKCRQNYYFDPSFRSHPIFSHDIGRQCNVGISSENLLATLGSLLSTGRPQPWNENPTAGHRQPRSILGARFKGGLSSARWWKQDHGPQSRQNFKFCLCCCDFQSVASRFGASLSHCVLFCKMGTIIPHNSVVGIKQDGVLRCAHALLTLTGKTPSLKPTRSHQELQGVVPTCRWCSFSPQDLLWPPEPSGTSLPGSPPSHLPRIISCLLGELSVWICSLLPQHLFVSRDLHIFFSFQFWILAHCLLAQSACSKNRDQLISHLLLSPRNCPRVMS